MIDPELRAVLRSKFSIRRFFLLYGGVLLVAVLFLILTAAYAPLGWGRDTLFALLSTFGATLTVFILTYAFYLFITPPGLRNAEVIPLRSAEIADEIVDLASHTNDYWFWGRSGSYLRAEVIPRLDSSAAGERRHVRMRIVLPDPQKNGNAQLYRQIKEGLGEAADDNTLSANVAATILSVVVRTVRNPYLHAQIGLSSTVPVIRYDMSSTGLLITRDAKSLPAILINSGNGYFEMFRDAIESELAQCKRIEWDEDALRNLDTNDWAAVALHVKDLPFVDASVLTRARTLSTEKKHRYG